MADLVFPLATTLVEKLGSIVSDEISSAWGVQADLQKLQRTMSIVKDVLLDAEQKQARNKQIRSWLKQLKDVFLDAENLLDEFECEALRREVVETFHGTPGKVRRFLSPSNPIAFRVRVGNEIKDISERLDELKSNCAIFDSLTILPHGYGGDDHERPFVPASKVIGRQYEKKQIVNLLMQQGDDDQSGNSNNKVSVIPIVGIGGLGKTTFAKTDKRVVGHFDLRMWASVPVDFELTRLTRLILGSALDTKISDKLAMDQLQGTLREALKDKKFLLVLHKSYLTSLRTLLIGNCEQLDLGNVNYQGTPLRLQKLSIINLPRMVALPEWFQGAANTLQVLVIGMCENLEALPDWLASFTSLTKLVIDQCQKLLSLPEGMRSLTSLKELVVDDCPELERRCQCNIGEDWPKISHVPHVSLSSFD
ncbi:PREDICTED: disease resistance [Prunus dulcis]|uniref:PREDICTED: disease resistance n=1 Tax=Prunus dulcis TaxID=3755 RepID=A0A5E4GFV6_PRUDU|nr:PREDICTED: disease resistance [Prunus dulcis]